MNDNQNKKENTQKLQKILGYEFQNQSLLITALTHRSVPGKKAGVDYERLEFLGDAVIDLVVAALLIEHHPKAREGELSKMRAALVNTESLASVAKEIKLGDYIRLSRGEKASGGAERPSILADVTEAVVGAIFLDSGFDAAAQCTKQFLEERTKVVIPSDPKTELQETLHTLGSEAPVYKLECVEGPEHAPNFISIVEVKGETIGRGEGATKKASQQQAASEALKQLSDE